MLRVFFATGLALSVSFAQAEESKFNMCSDEFTEDGIVENNDVLPEDLMSSEELTILMDQEEAEFQAETSSEEPASSEFTNSVETLRIRPRRPHRPPVIVHPPHRPPVVVRPPHRPPVIVHPPHHPPRPGGSVICQAQNGRGMVFYARGARPIIVQQRALNRCYGESLHCVALGCYRTY